MCSVLLDDRQAFRHSSLSLYCGCCYEVLPISNCHRGLWESFQQSHPEKATTVEETGFHSSYRCTSLHTHVFLMKPSAQERSLQKKVVRSEWKPSVTLARLNNMWHQASVCGCLLQRHKLQDSTVYLYTRACFCLLFHTWVHGAGMNLDGFSWARHLHQFTWICRWARTFL